MLMAVALVFNAWSTDGQRLHSWAPFQTIRSEPASHGMPADSCARYSLRGTDLENPYHGSLCHERGLGGDTWDLNEDNLEATA